MLKQERQHKKDLHKKMLMAKIIEAGANAEKRKKNKNNKKILGLVLKIKLERTFKRLLKGSVERVKAE